MQAKIAFQKKDFQKAETFLLRADRPDIAASFYKVTITQLLLSDDVCVCTVGG